MFFWKGKADRDTEVSHSCSPNPDWMSNAIHRHHEFLYLFDFDRRMSAFFSLNLKYFYMALVLQYFPI